MAGPAPFRPRVFLYRTLVGIFLVEAIFLGFAFWKCSAVIPGQSVPLLVERCPKLGSRSQELFSIAISTCLALLSTGVQDSKATKQSDSESKEQ